MKSPAKQIQGPSIVRGCGSNVETVTRLKILEKSLTEFYRSKSAYSAFQPGAEHEGAGWHKLILKILSRCQSKPVRILEIGAGRSGFANALGPFRGSVIYHAQDVTEVNRAFLETCADKVIIDPVENLTERYDLIFHTFVLEHVVFPERFLEAVDRLLNSGGLHVVICPKYDVPGYINPSMRHLGWVKIVTLTLYLAWRRLIARLHNQSDFLINCVPAVFHVPWYRDADAVHLVSGFDVHLWHQRRGYKMKKLQPFIGSFRDRLFKRLCLLAAAFRKPLHQESRFTKDLPGRILGK